MDACELQVVLVMVGVLFMYVKYNASAPSPEKLTRRREPDVETHLRLSSAPLCCKTAESCARTPWIKQCGKGAEVLSADDARVTENMPAQTRAGNATIDDVEPMNDDELPPKNTSQIQHIKPLQHKPSTATSTSFTLAGIPQAAPVAKGGAATPDQLIKFCHKLLAEAFNNYTRQKNRARDTAVCLMTMLNHATRLSHAVCSPNVTPQTVRRPLGSIDHVRVGGPADWASHDNSHNLQNAT